jgi:hypothetical protein
MLIENIIMGKIQDEYCLCGNTHQQDNAHTNIRTHISKIHPRDQLIGFSTCTRMAIIRAVPTITITRCITLHLIHGQGTPPVGKAGGPLFPVAIKKIVTDPATHAIGNGLFVFPSHDQDVCTGPGELLLVEVSSTPKKHISPDSKKEMKSHEAMGNQYLNSGESIILTTHSISVDEGLYDVLLTNERIVLVDNKYTRFEPRTIPFTQVISVKGGRVPTGEPVITLVLTETGALADSRDRHLIFTQQPGEERRHERDLWVKRLIELVIAARQHTAGKETPAREQEPGVKPSVRRWEAPDHLLPRTRPEKRPAPAKVVVEPDGTELAEFLFEESVPASELPDEEMRGRHPAETRRVDAGYPEPEETGDTNPAPTVPVPFPVLIRSHFLDEIRQQDPEVSPSSDIQEGNTPAYTGVADEADDLLASEGNDRTVTVPFSSTISAAIASLASPEKRQDRAEQPVSQVTDESAGRQAAPSVFVIEESVPANCELPPAVPLQDVTGAGEIPDADPHTHGNNEVILPGVGNIAEDAVPTPAPVPSEAPSAPHRPVIVEEPSPRRGVPERKVQAVEPKPALPPQEKTPAKRALLPAILAVLVILVIVVGVVLFTHYLPAPQVSPVDTVVTPAITVPPTVAPVLKNTTETGVRVRVISPGPYVGTIGNPEFLHQVSGSGDQSYTVLKNDDLVSVTLRKQDNDGAPLTVEIYNYGFLLVTRTVTAPQGEIILLIDPDTGSPPGITPTIMHPATGNVTLTDY